MITYEEVQKVKNIGTLELRMLVYWLYGFKPVLNCVIEIGVSTGGSSVVWQLLLAPDGIFVGVDINQFGNMEKTIQRFKDDNRMNFIIADSRAPETLDKVKALLGNRPVDFLYLDGEHSQAGTKKDYEIYSPLVAEGGVIAFHDATRNSNVRRAIESIIEVYKLKDSDSEFDHICRFDSRKGHCGVFAMVKRMGG